MEVKPHSLIISFKDSVGSSMSFGHMNDDVKRLNCKFRLCNWCFVHRSNNEIAYNLVSYFLSVFNFVSWMEEDFEFLLPPFQFDISN